MKTLPGERTLLLVTILSFLRLFLRFLGSFVLRTLTRLPIFLYFLHHILSRLLLSFLGLVRMPTMIGHLFLLVPLVYFLSCLGPCTVTLLL